MVIQSDDSDVRWTNFTRNLTDWIKNSGGTTFSLSMTASTGGAKTYNKFNLEHSSIQNQLLLKYAM